MEKGQIIDITQRIQSNASYMAMIRDGNLRSTFTALLMEIRIHRGPGIPLTKAERQYGDMDAVDYTQHIWNQFVAESKGTELSYYLGQLMTAPV